jgi:hypothetical protein
MSGPQPNNIALIDHKGKLRIVGGLPFFYAVMLLAATLYMLIMVFGLMESDEYVMKIQ